MRLLHLRHIIFLSLIMLLQINTSQSVKAAPVGTGEDFDAGAMIIDHVIDAHEWHLFSIGDKHYSIYLPVILYYNQNFYFFSSRRFDHGYKSYKGFKIESEGPHKGKIVRTIDGTMKTDHDASRPLDFSITKHVVVLFFSIIMLIVIFLTIAKKYKRHPNEPPSGFQSLIEPLIIFIRDDVAKSAIGQEKFEKYTPYLLTLFFFIFFNNLLGLIPIFPGGANFTGDITVAMTLALFTFIITQIIGTKTYWVHIFNTPGVPWYMKFPIPLMPIIEVASMFIKPFVLMVRLFANITAGHLIVLGFISLIIILGQINMLIGYSITIVSVPLAVFMSLVELIVAFIQAYVFTLLTALYFGVAVEESH